MLSPSPGSALPSANVSGLVPHRDATVHRLSLDLYDGRSNSKSEARIAKQIIISKAAWVVDLGIMSLDLDDIRVAHERIRPHIRRTPVLTSTRLDEARRASLFFKCENFQKGGAFKARGATNAVFALDDATARRGAATHSSGNHG